MRVELPSECVEEIPVGSEDYGFLIPRQFFSRRNRELHAPSDRGHPKAYVASSEELEELLLENSHPAKNS